MDELRLVPEAEGGPAVLRVETAVGRPLIHEPGDHRLQEHRERPRRLESCRLVGDPDLERAEARMRTRVPPDPGDLVGEAERDEALDEPLPVLVAAEHRRARHCAAGARGSRRAPSAAPCPHPRRTASSRRVRAPAAARARRPRAPPCMPRGSPCPRARGGRRRTAAALTDPHSGRISGTPGSRRPAARPVSRSARCPPRRERSRPLPPPPSRERAATPAPRPPPQPSGGRRCSARRLRRRAPPSAARRRVPRAETAAARASRRRGRKAPPRSRP